MKRNLRSRPIPEKSSRRSAQRSARSRGTRWAAAAAAALLLGAAATQADDLCWSGGGFDNEFTNAANWTAKTTTNCPSPNFMDPAASAPPGAGDLAEFSGGTVLGPIQVPGASGVPVGQIRSRLNTVTVAGAPLILDGLVDPVTSDNLLILTVGSNLTVGNDLVLQLDPGQVSGTGVIETVQSLGPTTLVLGGAISGPAAMALHLKPQGATAIHLDGANTYAGGTILEAGNSQGTVRVGSNTAFGTGPVSFVRGTLRLATPSLGNDIEVGNAAVALKSDVADATLGGALSGSGSAVALNVGDNNSTHTARVILEGDNSGYEGSIAVFQSTTLNVRHPDALGTTAKGTGLNFDAVLEVEGGITVNEPLTVGAANGSATLRSVSGDNVWNGTVSGAPRLEVNVLADRLTVGGAWGLNFNKTGPGIFQLDAANANNLGEMAVSEGTLLVNGSIGGSAQLQVASGATLGGLGTINANVLVQGTLSPGGAGGTLAPGTDIGDLVLGGDLTFDPTAIFHVDLEGAFADSLTILGNDSFARTVLLDGLLDLNATGAVVPGSIFVILETGTNVTLSGTFAGLPEGADLDGFLISYLGGDGNDVTLTATAAAVPEPSAIWLVLSSLVALPIVFRSANRA